VISPLQGARVRVNVGVTIGKRDGVNPPIDIGGKTGPVLWARETTAGTAAAVDLGLRETVFLNGDLLTVITPAEVA
jgi:hypothetical protein